MTARLGKDETLLGHHYLVPQHMEHMSEPAPRFVARDVPNLCYLCKRETNVDALITRQLRRSIPEAEGDLIVLCPPCAHAAHHGGRRWARHQDWLRGHLRAARKARDAA